MKFQRVVLHENNSDPNAEKEINKMPEEAQETIQDLRKYLNIKEPIENPSLVHEALDKSLKLSIRANRRGQIAGPASNLLFVGRAGTGKTAQIKQWAKARNINLVAIDAKTLDKSDIGGGVARAMADDGTPTNKMTHLANEEFDKLDEPGSVLFLDELNRADPEVMGSLLTLILDHEIPNSTEAKGVKKLNNLLFTVAAINPADYYEGTNAMDAAMLNRFRRIDMGETDTTQYRKHILSKLSKKKDTIEKEIKSEKDPDFLEDLYDELTAVEGKMKLADKILRSSMFAWDSIEEEVECTENGASSLSPRSFSAAIEASEGKKDGLLQVWSQLCNPNKQDMIEQILTDYVDVEDKANDALKYKGGFMEDEEELEDIFSGSDSAWDKALNSGLFDALMR